MSVYMTEAEQLDNIRRWWNKYSNTVLVIISVILLGIAAYRYWDWHKDKVTTQASNTYEQMMLAFAHQNNKSVQSYANQLIKDYPKTVYANAAHLLRAKIFVSKDKLNLAAAELKAVIQNSDLPALQQVARLRLARILAANKSYKEALTELDTIVDQGYLLAINELKGDIYVATGQYQQAIAAYRSAINETRTNGMGNLFLEMKTNEVAALTQSLNKASDGKTDAA